MPLVQGRDFLFFEKVDCSQQSLTAALTRGAAVMTPNLIAMIPVQGIGSIGIATVGTRHSLAGTDPVGYIRSLLSDPTLGVADLEATLRDLYGQSKTRWLFPVAELEKWKMGTGFFGQATLKMPGESVRRMNVRDKGGKVAAKAFYASALGARG